MTETTTPAATMAAFKKIVAALKAVKGPKRPALLDLAMREALDGEVPCDCHGDPVDGPKLAQSAPPADQGSLL